MQCANHVHHYHSIGYHQAQVTRHFNFNHALAQTQSITITNYSGYPLLSHHGRKILVILMSCQLAGHATSLSIWTLRVTNHHVLAILAQGTMNDDTSHQH